jgi:hypothetical protein
VPTGVTSYRLTVKADVLKVLIARTTGPFGSPDVARAAGEGIRKWGALVQASAVYNVTGHPVIYDGRVFRVMVRTGTLRNSIELQWPYQTRFQARVFVNGTLMNPGGPGRPRPTSVAAYANAIEDGHDAIDLKKTMQGKIVPFFGSVQERARGPFAAEGLKPLDTSRTDYGSKWQSATLDRKLAAKNKAGMQFTKKGGNPAYQGAKRGASTYFISFRRVGKTGWIIPEAAPRPFMRAALERSKEPGRRMLVATVSAALDPTRR